MKLLPVLNSLPAILDMAGQLVSAARTARAEARPAAEELANLEKMAEKQAELVRELAIRVEELAAETQENREQWERMNRRSSWVLGVALAAASLAVTAAVYVLLVGG